MQNPVITITLDHMRQSIAHALQTRHTEMEEAVDEALRNVVRTFNYEEVVRVEAQRAITEAIKHAITRAFYDPRLKNTIDIAIRDLLQQI